MSGKRATTIPGRGVKPETDYGKKYDDALKMRRDSLTPLMS